MDQGNSKMIFPIMDWTHCTTCEKCLPNNVAPKMTHKPNEKNIESTKPIYEGDPEETAIKKLER